MGKSTRIQRVNKDMFCSVQQDCIINQVEKIYEAVLLSTQNMFDWLMDNNKKNCNFMRHDSHHAILNRQCSLTSGYFMLKKVSKFS